MHSMNQLAELFGRLDILYNSGLSNSFLLLSRWYVCKSMDNSVKLTPTLVSSDILTLSHNVHYTIVLVATNSRKIAFLKEFFV